MPRSLPAALLAVPFLLAPVYARGQTFNDPSPPSVAQLPPQRSVPAQPNLDATFHAAPQPLPRDAATHDWTGFLGPLHNGVSTETKLLARFPKDGPALVWEVKKGTGYSAPAVAGKRVVLIHRVEDQEVVDCMHAETGERFWRFSYPSGYVDRYGYCDGPRASPVIGGDGNDSVCTIGAEGKLHCFELSTGRVRWSRNLLEEFKLKQNFFGVGSTPLIEGGKLIVNVGAAPDGPCVAAFDLRTGKLLWGAGKTWGPSYASPIPATVYGRRRVFVFAGGETPLRERPNGGLLCIDPENGQVDFTFPWRGKRRESVNASSPLVLADSNPAQVFISECYGSGGVMLDVIDNGPGKPLSCKVAWANANFGTHFMTAVEKAGYLYGVDGHGPQDAFLVCVERKTGKEIWRKQPEWEEKRGSPDERPDTGRSAVLGTYRCALMPVGDGRCLCLGEYGHLLWLDLGPAGYKEHDRTWLFAASETWTAPVLSRGLLYVNQNTKDTLKGTPPRLICYDLRQ